MPVQLILTILFLPGYCIESPTVSVQCSKTEYSSVDTVIVAVNVHIPDGFVLIGNPKGPGVGRPLKMKIRSTDGGIHWLEVRKTEAKKYGPPFGEWVWADSDKAVFFCTGLIPAMDRVLPFNFNGNVEIEGLFCRNECRLVIHTVPFTVKLGGEKRVKSHFYEDMKMLEKYQASKTMMVLEQVGY